MGEKETGSEFNLLYGLAWELLLLCLEIVLLQFHLTGYKPINSC